jgi:hypothetical protein
MPQQPLTFWTRAADRGDDRPASLAAGVRNADRRRPVKEFVRYALAVLAFIGVSFLTKNFLTWTTGPLFFVIVLEVIPRTVRRYRASRSDGARA